MAYSLASFSLDSFSAMAFLFEETPLSTGHGGKKKKGKRDVLILGYDPEIGTVAKFKKLQKQNVNTLLLII